MSSPGFSLLHTHFPPAGQDAEEVVWGSAFSESSGNLDSKPGHTEGSIRHPINASCHLIRSPNFQRAVG